ncbi:MAG: XdhC family protein [Chloroflexi bacterium]|nr:XdhC family protein [Chloroflexota bacterium]
MDAISQAIVDALQNNKHAAIATVVKTRGTTPRNVGAKMFVYPDGTIVGSIGGGETERHVIAAAQQAMNDGQPHYLELKLADHGHGDSTTCDDAMEIFVEPLLTAPTLVIIGAGHVGAAVAQLAKTLGFRIVVIDDRPDLLTPQNFSHADERMVGDIVARAREIEMTPQTFVVLATRAHALDAALLGALIAKPAAYIGMLGSDKRAQAAKDAMSKQDVPEELLARLHMPIGIEIGAETPQEIAVSIMAEIIQVKRQK